MSTATQEYAFGKSVQEYNRLERQGKFYRPMTQRLFEDAGITRGMRVLDVGSGAGDVCLLLSEIVGLSGHVVGVEADAGAVAHARRRVWNTGANNISFVSSDLSQYEPEGAFDAIVGRLILMYQPDPSAVLARLCKHLRPGGIVAFMEPWMVPPAGPDNPMKTILTCMTETLRRSGAHVDLGPKLHRVFMDAGLPQPQMRFEAVVDGSENSELYQVSAESYANLLPRAIAYNVPIAEGLDIESVPDAFQSAMKAAGYAAIMLPTMMAWAKAN